MNSWGSARSGGRQHQGIDILASRNTPVVSTTRGVVLSVGTNTLGGHVVWIRDGVSSHTRHLGKDSSANNGIAEG